MEDDRPAQGHLARLVRGPVGRALCLIRPQPHYRSDVFLAGLKAAGFTVGAVPDPRPSDLLVIWNRYGEFDVQARRFERAGAQVLVVENGYLGKDANGRQHYAIALGGHNGSGRWRIGGPERWEALGIELKPWRASGDHIVVRAQRGIGTPLMASPVGWHTMMAQRLRLQTKRPIVVRQHPAQAPEQPSLEQQLEGGHALVTWASSDAGKALVMGVPVFYCAPHLVCSAACRRGIGDLENPSLGDRLPAMTALAWAQWSLEEIGRGEPFKWLLEAGWC